MRTIVMGQKLLIFELQILYPQKNVKPNDDTFDEASYKTSLPRRRF